MDDVDSPMQIRLFGGVAADVGGAPVDVGPAKCQALLAALALSAGAAVPVHRLVGLVWGLEPPRTAEKTLQSYATRLRKGGLGAGSIARIGAAYRLDVEPGSVDVLRFQRHLAAGAVEAALSEWTGLPLAGLDAPGLAATVDGLVEQWLGAMEGSLAHRIETDAAAAIASLTELTATHPFREGMWALLMTALYRVGRQADALAAYRKARRHLVSELGVEPGPRLRQLETLILNQDEHLAVEPPGARVRAGPEPGPGPGPAAEAAGLGPAPGLPTGTVTFGFTEIEDRARLWANHRPEMVAVTARTEALVRSAAAEHGGHVFATGGSSLGVAFHRTSDAIAWTRSVQAAVRREPWPGGIDLRLRIGLHTGETEEHAGGYFGEAVNLAAALTAAGHGGQILVSAVIATLAGPQDLHVLGTYRLDGVVAEQRVFQVGDDRHPPLRSATSQRGNLPRTQSRLVGRDDDLAAVTLCLGTSPVVTLVGPGGIGKTSLALAAAELTGSGRDDRAGGTWLVELAGITSPDDVPRAVAATLAVQEHTAAGLGAAERPGQTLTRSVVTALQARPAILLLDNCEHVIGAAAELARAIVEACPDTRILATSREGLGIVGEQLIAVPPLDPAGSGAELFRQRALAADRTFDLDADRAAVAELCHRLDGVPLAIELAAARTRSLSPAELVERLDDLRLLSTNRRDGAERHRTLRATIGWSYDLLTPPQQTLFQRLAIFAGPFDLDAAEQVTAAADLDAVEVADLLRDLIDRSMVVAESGPFGRRLRLLETMRQFAAEHLDGSGQTELLARRHAQWCRDQVAHAHRLLSGRAEIEGVARLDELWPNLRAAVGWATAAGDPGLARSLIQPIAPEIYLRSRSEIGDWAEQILAVTPDDDEELILFGVTWAARRYMRNVDLAGYERLVHRYGEPDHPMIRYARAFVETNRDDMAKWAPVALAALRRQGDDYGADLFEVVALATSLLLAGRVEELELHLLELVDRYRANGPPTCLGLALNLLGYSARLRGDHAGSVRYFNQAAEVEVPERTQTLKNPLAARAALRRGDRAQAFDALRSYVAELLDNDNLYLAATAEVEFVTMMADIGRVSEANRVLAHVKSTTGTVVAFRPLVAEAADRLTAKVGTNPEPVAGDDPAPGAVPGADAEAAGFTDDREALTWILDVLDQLITRSP